jgi:putative DNA primase/helicase
MMMREQTAPVKSNIGPDTDGFAYSVQSVTLPKGIKTSKVVFEDAVHRVSADELLGERSEGGEALKEAKEFLEGMLGDGPREAKKIKAEAYACGIKEKTLQRAKDALRIKSDKGRDAWSWRLPGNKVSKPNPVSDADAASQ